MNQQGRADDAGEVTVGFVEENGGRAISQNVTMGQSFIIPAGAFLFDRSSEYSPSVGSVRE